MNAKVRSRSGRPLGAARPAAALALVAVLGLLAGCAGGAGVGGGDVAVAGDDKGGKIPGGVGEGGRTAASMRAVSAHCAKFGKKPYITMMDSPAQGGMMAFVCLDR